MHGGSMKQHNAVMHDMRPYVLTFVSHAKIKVILLSRISCTRAQLSVEKEKRMGKWNLISLSQKENDTSFAI